MATVGGKATAGIRSRRKLAAAMRNLKKARHVRKLNRLRAKAEVAYTTLQHYRNPERVELEAAIAEDRVFFKQREDLILGDPVLRSVYQLLRHAEPVGQPTPASNSVLSDNNEFDRY